MSEITKTNNGLSSLMGSDKVKEKFTEILGKKANSFIMSVIQITHQNAMLKDCEPSSIVNAALTAATMDLPINQQLGYAYIVPYNNRQKDGTVKKQAQMQIGYKGLIQLAQRSGQFKTIASTPVYEGQIETDDPLSGVTFDWSAKVSDRVIGFAAHFKLLNGFEKTLFMTVDAVSKHGAKYSKTYKHKNGLWATDFETMAEKTVLKLLLAKFAPLSTEMQRAVIADQSVINDTETMDVEYVDNDRDYLDPEAVSERKENERIVAFIEKAKTLEELEQVQSSLTNDDQVELYESKVQELGNK